MRWAQARVFLLFAAAYFLSYFFRSANAILAPDLRAEMGLSAADLGLMTSLFFAAFAAVQMPLGVGLDRWGPRWVTPGLMLAGAAGSLLFARAASFGALALGRALIGVGMAGVLMGTLKMFSLWFTPQRYATVSGLLVGVGSTGALVAATPLAWISARWGWRSAFSGGAFVILAVALAIVFFTRNAPPGVDWPRQSGRGGFGPIVRDLRFWRLAPLLFCTNGVLLAFQGLWAGPYLLDLYALDRLGAGNILLLIGLSVTLGFVISGWLADRIGIAQVIVLGSAVLVAALGVLALRPPLWLTVAAGSAFGLFGAFTLMLLAQTRGLFPPALTGRAVTAVNLFAIGGTFLLQWAMGALIGLYPEAPGGGFPPAAYRTALLTTAALTLAALLWYLPMLRNKQP